MRTSVSLLAAVFAFCISVGSTPAFAQPGAATVKGPASVMVDPSYKINPGDQLNVVVYGEQSLTQTAVVLDDGSIQYPMIGRVQVAGKTPTEAANLIKTALLQYVRHPIVTVALGQAGQNNVLVLGNVKTPGKYVVRSGAHVSDAIAVAGGLGPTDGPLPDARVTQASGAMQKISLQRLIVGGDNTQNVALGNNAVVYVIGPLPIRIQVLGSVDKPGYVEVHEGDRLSVAIAAAGTSANSKADLNHVFITRDVNGHASKQEVNMYNALKGGDRNSDPVLQKDDVVYVPMARQSAPFSPFSLIQSLLHPL